MILLLVPVYTYTGYYLGSLFGNGLAGAVAGWIGSALGFVIGMLVILKLVFSVDYLGTGLLAAIGLGAAFYIPPSWKPWWLVTLCLLPVLRRYDLVLGKSKQPDTPTPPDSGA